MSLNEYLNELAEALVPLSAQGLTTLSNLVPEDLDLLRQVWPELSAERRQEIASRLVALAEENVGLSFEPVFRLGLEDSDGWVREQAVLGLWECEERTIIEPLSALLRMDEEEKVRVAAAWLLGQFALLGELGKLLPEDTRRVVGVLLEAAEDLDEALEVRRRAVEALGPGSSPQVRQLIRDSYESADDSLRESALSAMGRSRDDEWLPLILDGIESPSPALRFEGAKAAGELASEEAVPNLIALTDDPDPDVQWAAVNALGAIGGAESLEALSQCLAHPDSHVQEAARDALAQIQTEQDPTRLMRDEFLAGDGDFDEEDEDP